jgi:hypothetical protein
VSGDSVLMAYGLERDHQRLIERMRVSVTLPELDAGLPDAGKAPRTSREVGDVAVVNEPKIAADYPALSCVSDGCFLVWHEFDKGGAQAAYLDPRSGSLVWRKRFAPRGGHPALAAGPGGKVLVVYYEGNRVRVAPVSRDGVGTASTLAHVIGDPPRAWIAPGRQPGEWYIAWLDIEAQHTEPLAARVQCRE